MVKEVAGRGQNRGKPELSAGLDGKSWLRYSISIWDDIIRTSEERLLGHPAMFPTVLTDRLIRIFYRGQQGLVLDPFLGSGSTVCSAYRMGIPSVGFELAPEYLEISRKRLQGISGPPDCQPRFYQSDSRHLSDYLSADSVGLCLTSPPYWDILRQRRSADGKEPRNYGDRQDDLGNIADYQDFLLALGEVFSQAWITLKPGAYCLVVVMDIRKGPKFYPFHMDLTRIMIERGYILDDMVIWDRRREYNNLRPLGYPSVFRINKVHEFIMIFQKPKL